MDETAVTPSDLTIEAILIALADELEAALDAVASARAEERFEEVLTRCVNAAALAQAGQLLASRAARS